MKAAVYHGIEDIRIEELPIPEIEEGEILLRVMSCAICGTDLRIYKHGHKKVNPPHIIGHEVAGIIESVGKGVTGYEEGERVLLVTEVSCNLCKWCLDGRKNLCAKMQAFGYYYPGGFAQFMKIPKEAVEQANLIPFPDTLSFEEASLIEPFSCCINGQEYLNIALGDKVVIVGAGPIGLMHAALAKSKGAKIVILVDISSSRLEMAKPLPIDFFVDASREDPVKKVKEITAGEGVDVAIVACPSGQAQAEALEMVGIRGRVSFFGGLPPEKSRITIDSNVIHYKEIGIFGAFASSNQHYYKALRVAASGNINLKKLITASYPLGRIAEGFQLLSQGKAIKIVINPWE